MAHKWALDLTEGIESGGGSGTGIPVILACSSRLAWELYRIGDGNSFRVVYPMPQIKKMLVRSDWPPRGYKWQPA
jgi:hypothetical protein